MLAVPAATAAARSTPTPASTQTATPGQASTYLTEEIPPCTPVAGSSVDPCEPREEGAMITSSGGLIISDVPLGVKGVFNGAPTTPIFTTHIALRGTYLPGTVRCTSGNRLRFPSYVDSPQPDWLLIYCFADVSVNAYLLGTGPSTLTVIVEVSLYAWRGSDDDYGLEQLESLRSAYERALSEGGRFEYADPLQGVLPPDGGLGPLRLGYTDVPMVTGPPGGIGGREFVLFVGPLYDLSVEAWDFSYTWDLKRREDDTVVALHPYRRSFNREQQSYAEVELPALTQEVTAAHQARVVAYGGRIGGRSGLPMLVTDANQLRQFFSDPKVGAYAHGGATAAALRPRGARPNFHPRPNAGLHDAA